VLALGDGLAVTLPMQLAVSYCGRLRPASLTSGWQSGTRSCIPRLGRAVSRAPRTTLFSRGFTPSA
jgi:hypothetical protein